MNLPSLDPMTPAERIAHLERSYERVARAAQQLAHADECAKNAFLTYLRTNAQPGTPEHEALRLAACNADSAYRDAEDLHDDARIRLHHDLNHNGVYDLMMPTKRNA